LILRYGCGFNALRDGQEGAQSMGVLFNAISSNANIGL
jgi:hypothetical protein